MTCENGGNKCAMHSTLLFLSERQSGRTYTYHLALSFLVEKEKKFTKVFGKSSFLSGINFVDTPYIQQSTYNLHTLPLPSLLCASSSSSVKFPPRV
jgi:hypothetical protein